MSTVWIVQTQEPDSDIVAVFATREAMEHEYPGWRSVHKGLVLERSHHEDLYADEYPLLVSS